MKIGVGFTNRDGSLSLRLDAVPVNGKLQVRDSQPFGENGWDWRPDARPELGGEAAPRPAFPRVNPPLSSTPSPDRGAK